MPHWRRLGSHGVIALGALAAACGGGGKGDGNWLTGPSYDTHARFFPLVGTVHVGIDCATCHSGNSFAQFDCTTCHARASTDPIHSGVAGYQWTSAGCYGCHPSGSGPAPAGHDGLFPISTGAVHATVTCSQCHTNLADPTNLANLSCASCHATLGGFSTAHGSVAGVSASTTSAQCLGCHGDSQVNRLSAHTQFAIARGSATHDTVCLQCHTTLRVDKPFAADFSAFACTACHAKPATDATHAGLSGYAYASASCYQCHPGGTAVGTPANHDTAFFPRGAGTAHASLTCSQCHTDLGNPTNPASFACAACHSTLSGFSTAHAKVAGMSATATSAQCLACHGDGQVNAVSAHTRFPIVKGSATHDTVCLQCHTAMRTDKPFAKDFSAFACTACHAQAPTTSAHAGVTGYVYASASCYQCHPGGTAASLPANHDTAFFPRGAGTAHAGIACTQCHTDLANPTNASAFACGSCHLARDASLVTKHTSPASRALTVLSSEISTTSSATCLRCHADAQVTTAHPSGGEGFPPHERAACLQCHDVYRTDKPFGLNFASDPALASKLASRQGCYHCHNTAPPRGN